MNTLISVIIINWNKKKYLATCLKSLFLNDDKLEVIVVDNASTDGSKEFLKIKYPKVKIIENRENLGFAQGNNQGFNLSKGKFVLFLNNDTKVTKGFLKPLVKVLKSDPRIGGVQGKILLLEDKDKLDSIGAFFTNTGFLYHYGFRKKNNPKLDKQIELFSAKGACMMFKRDVLEKLKVEGEVFDQQYFAYHEETDMCHRLWLAGFKIKYVPESLIFHKVGATSIKLGDSIIQYHSFKNRIDSYIKNLSLIFLVKVLPLHLFLCFVAAFTYLVRGKHVVSLAIIKSLIWNIFNLGQTLRKRKIIQTKIRKISDEKYLPGLTKPVGIDYFIAHVRGLESFND